MDSTDLQGRGYGPLLWRVAADSVTDFVRVTGDDADRWSRYAPPGFAAAALFAVAPDLLAELHDHSIVHGEQSFEWNRRLAVGSLFQVRGEVTRARDRGGVTFITFEMEARDGSDRVFGGTSLFLVSGEAISDGGSLAERPEPHHSHEGDPGPHQVSASRADLIRYASATRDWNPVHWDHDAAVAAGFPGIVVHGLLQAGWALRFAATDSDSTHPFASARFRFRSPLLVAKPVDHTIERDEGTIEVRMHDDENTFLTAKITPRHE